jgi:hypothetical protein
VAPAAAPAVGVTVSGTINTTPNTFVQVVVYTSPTNDGEGGTTYDPLPLFKTNAAGDGAFTLNLPAAPAGSWITATATSYAFTAETSETNTSEFSAPVSAAAAAPAVSAAYVRSSQWAAPDANPANVTFKEYLDAHNLGDDVYGFRVDNVATTPVLSWINLDQVVLHYSAPLTAGGLPQPAGITVRGDRAGGDYAVQSVIQLDPQTLALQLDRPLGTLAGGGEDGMRVAVTVPEVSPGAGPYTLRLDVLQGDVDASGSVLANDFSDVKKKFFRSTNSPSGASADASYSPFDDVDGSGSILANDYSEVKKRFFDAFITPTAAAGSARVRGVTADLFGTTPVL